MNKKALFTIFLIVFIDLLGFGIMIPTLPFYAQSFGASAGRASFLMVCYSLMQFIFSPFWGTLSDRYGRKWILLSSILGIGASYFLLSRADSLNDLYLSRLLAGFFAANISTASAYIADVTPPEKRAQGMGLIGAAFGLGFVMGPPIGGILSHHLGYSYCALSVCLLALINALFILVFLKEAPLSLEQRNKNRHKLSLDGFKQCLSNTQLRRLIFIFLIVTTGFSQLESIFSYFVHDRFGFKEKEASYLLAALGLVMVFVQGGAIRPMIKYLGEVKIIRLGLLLMTSFLFVTSFAYSLAFFTGPLLLLGLGYAFVSPSLSGLTSKTASAEHQGTIMGVYQSAGSLGRVLGPLSAGFLYDHLGRQSPLLLASLLFLIALLLILPKFQENNTF